MKDRGCFCFSSGCIKEKSLDDIKGIIKKIIKGYIQSTETKETVVGFEDIPVYSVDGNTFQYEGRSIRYYYFE